MGIYFITTLYQYKYKHSLLISPTSFTSLIHTSFKTRINNHLKHTILLLICVPHNHFQNYLSCCGKILSRLSWKQCGQLMYVEHRQGSRILTLISFHDHPIFWNYNYGQHVISNCNYEHPTFQSVVMTIQCFELQWNFR